MDSVPLAAPSLVQLPNDPLAFAAPSLSQLSNDPLAWAPQAAGQPEIRAVPGPCWPPPDVAEPSLEEQPLEFICQHSAAGSSAWQPVLWDEARRCFSFYLPRALGRNETEHFFSRLKETAPWQPLHDKTKTRVSRHTAWYTRASCNCAYTYGEDTRVEAKSQSDTEFRKVMDELVKCVFSKFPSLPEEAWPNCANLNLYEDGSEGVGWHADDELIFMGTARDCPILSLSLGGTREFWISLKASGQPDVKKGVVEMDLGDGDLLTLEGLMQKHCMHLVPRSSPSDEMRQEPRVNITFRWMRLHKHQCPYAKVALTFYQMAQQVDEAEEAGSDSPPALPAHKHDGMIVLDPAARTVKSTRSQRSSKHDDYERTAIMSPLPPSARALFGEGRPRKSPVSPEAPRPKEASPFIRGWSTGSGPMGAVKWQPCDACGHTCYGGGRPCQEGGIEFPGEWYCRCCWSHWAETEKQQASYQFADWDYVALCNAGGFPNGNLFMQNGWMG